MIREFYEAKDDAYGEVSTVNKNLIGQIMLMK